MVCTRKQTAHYLNRVSESKSRLRRSQRRTSQKQAQPLRATAQKPPEPKAESSPEHPSIAKDKTASSSPSSEQPLFIDPSYESTGPGAWKLVDYEPPNVETSQEEKDSVREVVKKFLQAGRALQKCPEPEPLDIGGDLNWDWKSLRLTSNAYGKLIYVLTNHDSLTCLEWLSYDWIPDKADGGTLIIRKKCSFQSEFTRALAGEIDEAVVVSERANGMDLWTGLRPQMRASVVVGNKLGMRTPCRCFQLQRKGQENDRIHSFVLEIGMAEKSKELPKIARSYIERGTLCVMTADILREGEYGGFTVTYSLYRRGKKTTPTPEGVTRYEVVESVKNLAPERKLGGCLNLTLFDFFPAEALKNHGLTELRDPRASVVISCKVLVNCLKQAWGGFETSFFQEMKQLERLLRD